MKVETRRQARVYRFEDVRGRDQELVHDCQRGDADAWEKLVRRHSPRIYALCRRFTGRATESHDLTQEILLRVFRTIGNFRADEFSFAAWLNLVTRNLLIDHYRRSHLERASISLDICPDAASRFASREHHGHAYERAEMQRHLLTAIAALPETLRETVALSDIEGCSYDEIAFRLGVPAGTVKSRLSRGRGVLAASLRRKGLIKEVAA